MAMPPSSRTSEASIRARAMAASGTGPPHPPECSACLTARTSTSTATSPRRAVVMEGRPVSKLLVSVSTSASADNSDRYWRRKSPRCADPISSSPSMKIFTFSGSFPAAFNQECTAQACTEIPALSSAAPRPNSRPSRSVGSNGGECHLASSPAGCTSWWAYSNTVGASGDAFTSPYTAGGAPSTSSNRTPWKPRSPSSFAVASADRRTSARSNPANAQLGMRTSRFRSSRYSPLAAAKWASAASMSLAMPGRD
jgi:hypothetical protein